MITLDTPAMLARSIPSNQLANRITRLIEDDDYWLEPKYDGIRTLVHITPDPQDPNKPMIKWRNRNGSPLSKPVPTHVENDLRNLAVPCVLDGELVGGALIVFDLLAFDNNSLLNYPMKIRREVLEQIGTLLTWAEVAERYQGAQSKNDAILEGVRANWEGVIFRNTNGIYHPGGRHTQLQKAKFTHTVDCFVGHTHIDDKENAELYLSDLDAPIGKCSLVGKPMVKPGDVVEIEYLYVKGSRLVQPRLRQLRPDKTPEQCTSDQLSVGVLAKPLPH